MSNDSRIIELLAEMVLKLDQVVEKQGQMVQEQQAMRQEQQAMKQEQQAMRQEIRLLKEEMIRQGQRLDKHIIVSNEKQNAINVEVEQRLQRLERKVLE
jgi:hypothetical protein